jgi:Ni,Fe-hydrogenase I large subunit
MTKARAGNRSHGGTPERAGALHRDREREGCERGKAVVPSTWNAGRREVNRQAGPYEAALDGEALHDPEQPLEILRTIHSFGPCIACAVHLADEKGEELFG